MKQTQRACAKRTGFRHTALSETGLPAYSILGNSCYQPFGRGARTSGRPRHYGLAHLVGSRGAILERYDSGVEEGSADQFQVDVGQASEDRLSTRAAEDLREHG